LEPRRVEVEAHVQYSVPSFALDRNAARYA
jgi:hypothetical protein